MSGSIKSAHFVLEQCYWCAGLFLNFLAETQDTDGQYTLIETVVRQGTEPPPHTHTYEDEALLVLEGELEIRHSSKSSFLKAGEVVNMPKGSEHYFRCVTPEVRLFIKLSPSGLESGFKSFGVPVKEFLLPPPREQVPGFHEIAQIFARWGVHFSLPQP